MQYNGTGPCSTNNGTVDGEPVSYIRQEWKLEEWKEVAELEL